MNNNLVAQEWFRYAKQDLDSAIYLQEMQPIPIEIIWYHCQQSVEKYLKGFIAFHGGAIQRVHDLVALNKICIKYDKDFMQIEEECLNLTDYGVQARYPFNLELNEVDAYLAIKSAEKTQAFLHKRVNVDMEK